MIMNMTIKYHNHHFLPSMLIFIVNTNDTVDCGYDYIGYVYVDCHHGMILIMSIEGRK